MAMPSSETGHLLQHITADGPDSLGPKLEFSSRVHQECVMSSPNVPWDVLVPGTTRLEDCWARVCPCRETIVASSSGACD